MLCKTLLRLRRKEGHRQELERHGQWTRGKRRMEDVSLDLHGSRCSEFDSAALKNRKSRVFCDCNARYNTINYFLMISY